MNDYLAPSECVPTEYTLVFRCQKLLMELTGEHRFLLKLHNEEVFWSCEFTEGMNSNATRLKEEATWETGLILPTLPSLHHRAAQICQGCLKPHSGNL